MPDDESVETPAVETPATPVVDPRDTAIADLRTQVAALNDSVRAALAPARPPISTGGGGNADGSGITPQLRQALRQQGLSDADITHNAPLILPFIAVVAPELVGLVESRIGGVDERLSLKELVDDGDSYPYGKDLKTEIRKVLADAKKDGKTISTEIAYHTAVSMNQEKCREVDATRRAQSAGTDASMLSGVGHRTSSNAGARAGGRQDQPRTAADLAKMTPEQRMSFYDKFGDTPIQ